MARAIIFEGRVLSIGADDEDAKRHLVSSARHNNDDLMGMSFVDATDAALRCWEDDDRDADDPCPAYLADDSVVRLPRNAGCTAEEPCLACDGCLYDVAPEDDETAPVTTFLVELTVRGDASDAAQALESALDGGVLQDAINEYEGDKGALTVVSAVQRYSEGPRRAPNRVDPALARREDLPTADLTSPWYHAGREDAFVRGADMTGGHIGSDLQALADWRTGVESMHAATEDERQAVRRVVARDMGIEAPVEPSANGQAAAASTETGAPRGSTD